MRAISCAIWSLNIFCARRRRGRCALLFCHISPYSSHIPAWLWPKNAKYEYLKAIHCGGRRCCRARAHYKLVCQADGGGGGGIAPNWRQIKLATHYVFGKNFQIVLATAPAAHYTLVPLGCSRFCPALLRSVRIGMATNHGQLLNGLLSENYGTPKAHKAFTMPRPRRPATVSYIFYCHWARVSVVGCRRSEVGRCRNPFAGCLP